MDYRQPSVSTIEIGLRQVTAKSDNTGTGVGGRPLGYLTA